MINKSNKIRKITAMLMVVVCMFTLAGCNKKKASKTSDSKLSTKVLTIDKTSYTLGDLMYTLYMTESDIDSTVSYYNMFGMDYWDTVKEEGGTKQGTIQRAFFDTAIWIHVMEDQAKKAGYKVSDADKKEIKETAKSILDEMSDKYKKQTGFTQDYLESQMERESLAYDYYMDQLDKIKVEADDVKDEYPYEDYREYETAYIYVPTVDYDEEGNVKKLSKDKIAKAKKKIDSLFAKVQSGTSLKDAYNNDESIEYGTVPVVKDDEGMPAEFTKAALSLKNGEIYKSVVTTDDGYYIIKMKNNNVKENYEDTINTAINDEKEAKFEDTYQTLLKKYKYTEQESALKSLTLGNYAYEHKEDSELEDDHDHEHEEEEAVVQD
ncbi:foldase protein PrsA precursor [Lachnospiraceae bacterium KM106-2]|nr:foldase protein PrsA precursor [Lachnospiraceae bacterium KM106-2]